MNTTPDFDPFAPMADPDYTVAEKEIRIPDSLAARAIRGHDALVPEAAGELGDDTLASKPPTTSCGNM